MATLTEYIKIVGNCLLGRYGACEGKFDLVLGLCNNLCMYIPLAFVVVVYSYLYIVFSMCCMFSHVCIHRKTAMQIIFTSQYICTYLKSVDLRHLGRHHSVHFAKPLIHNHETFHITQADIAAFILFKDKHARFSMVLINRV